MTSAQSVWMERTRPVVQKLSTATSVLQGFLVCMGLGLVGCQGAPHMPPHGLLAQSGAPVMVTGDGRIVQWDAQGKQSTERYPAASDVRFTQVLPNKTQVLVVHSDKVVFFGLDGSLLRYDRQGPDVVAASGAQNGSFYLLTQGGVVEEWKEGKKARELMLSWSIENPHVSLAAFSADGKRVVTVTENDTLARVWETAGGSLTQVLGGEFYQHTQAITALAVAANGKRVVTGGNDGLVLLWGLDEITGVYGNYANSAWAFDHPLVSVDVSPDANQVLAADNQGNAQIWRSQKQFAVNTYEAFVRWRSLPPLPEGIIQVAFSLNSLEVLVVTNDEKMHIFRNEADVSTGWPVSAGQLQVSPTGKHFFLVRNGAVDLWSLDAARSNALSVPLPLTQLRNLGMNYVHATFSSDGKWILATNYGWDENMIPYKPNLWNIQMPFSPSWVSSIEDPAGEGGEYQGPWLWPNRPYAMSKFDTRVGEGCQSLFIWDLSVLPTDPKSLAPKVGQIPCPGGITSSRVHVVAFSEDGNYVLPLNTSFFGKLGPDVSLYVYSNNASLADRVIKLKRPLDRFGGPSVLTGASFSHDGKRVLLHAYGGKIEIVDISNLDEPKTLVSWFPLGAEGYPHVLTVGWSQDNAWVFVAYQGGIHTFDSATGRHLSTLLTNDVSEIQQAALLPDSLGVLSMVAFKNRTELRLWKLQFLTERLSVSL